MVKRLLVVLGLVLMLFLGFKSGVWACTSCATASCGNCSGTSNGWRCSCSGYNASTGQYATCSGVSDSSCTVPPTKSPPTNTPVPPPPTAIPTKNTSGCTNGATAGYSTCFITSDTNCNTYNAGGTTGSCSFNTSSWCECVNGSWVKHGSGCTGSFSCKTGYSSSCPAGETCSAYTSECLPCGNSRTTCYLVVENKPDCPCGDTSKYCENVKYTASGATCTANPNCYGTRQPSCECAADTCVGQQCSDNCSGWCEGTKQPDCSDANQYCAGTTYTAANGCGTCTGTKSSSASWGSYGSCSSCSQSRSCDSTCGGSCSGSSTRSCDSAGCSSSCSAYTNSCGYSCPKTIADVAGANGACGSDNGGMFSSTPSSNLCSTGSASSVSLAGRTYSWTCAGLSGQCAGATGSSASCTAFQNRAPSFSLLEVRNTDGVNVPSDNVSGVLANQICQTQFSSNRTAVLRVTATDPDGSSDIASIQLRMGGATYNPVAPISGGVAVFNIQYGVNSPGNTNLNQIDVIVTDIYGAGGVWQSTGHSFKFWDCKVPISGTVYDGSAGSLCSTSLGYTTTVPAGLVFGLSYRNGANSRNMSVASPLYNDGGNRLDWGETYIPLFTDFPGGGMNEIKVVDVKTGTNICLGDFSLTLNNSLVNPYSDGPTLIADYSAVMDQLPWFQVSGGAAISKVGVRDSVPITCGLGNSCKPAVTIDNISIGTSNNGLVAGTFSSNSGCSNGCKYGNPNNWNTTADLLQEGYGYDYFYREFYVKSGQGTVLSGDATMTQVKAALADIGGTGIVFVENNLDVNENLSVPVNSFAMIVAKNNINIQETVNRVDGVLVAVNINASGKSANQLIINGTIQANNSVNFTRGYSTDSTNNTSPSVQVNYRPDFLFKMPGQLIKTISGWKQGL